MTARSDPPLRGVSELVNTHYDLDDVALGYEDMLAGKNIRGVIVF